jgi:hypothetical protein
MLFFAWSVNKNMLPVTLNHMHKKKVENPEWKADVTEIIIYKSDI